jgi:Dyp-type peroxidase family
MLFFCDAVTPLKAFNYSHQGGIKMAINIGKPLDDTVISNQEKSFMQHLQANILKGHGREHVALIFLSIKDVASSRKFLHSYPATDSFTQHLETENFKRTRTPGGIVRLAFLTKSGLDVFGHASKFASFGVFSGGMTTDSSVLDEGTTTSWQPELKQTIHVLLLIAHHDDAVLARTVGSTIDDSSAAFDVVFVQEGRAYKNGDGEGIEHFGYVDGRSQPLMIQSSINEEADKRRGGIDKYDPTAPLGQFIIPDPLDSAAFGSFFVFRKLEQNVAGFKRAEDELGEFLGLLGDDKERAGAMVVGRFEDGTPLTLHDKEDGVPVINNFDYSADANGSKCPFHGHIRKSNPRGSSPGGLIFDKSVQMARRGITYGSRLQHPDSKEFIDEPNDGVGLLFMSYQASIEKQFQFMQTKWVNSADFPKPNVGVDPIIGQRGTLAQSWLPTYGSNVGAKQKLFEGFVKLKGGEYFFTPSITGLRNL